MAVNNIRQNIETTYIQTTNLVLFGHATVIRAIGRGGRTYERGTQTDRVAGWQRDRRSGIYDIRHTGEQTGRLNGRYAGRHVDRQPDKQPINVKSYLYCTDGAEGKPISGVSKWRCKKLTSVPVSLYIVLTRIFISLCS
jgi:hypothetical protein